MSHFPTASVTTLPHEYSDHSSIILQTNFVDFGPPPFWFYNSWLLRDGIDHVIFSAWSSYAGNEPPNKHFFAKLKAVKLAVIEWRRIEFEKEHKNLLDIKARVNFLDGEAESRTLIESEKTMLKMESRKLLSSRT